MTEEFSNNASASDNVGLETNDDIGNQTTRIHFSSENTVNSSDLFCKNTHTEKLQNGGKYENTTCENGSDHEIVDEADIQSDKQNHYKTIAPVNTALSRTLEGGSDDIDNLHYAEDRKRAASIDFSSDFLEHDEDSNS